MDLFISNDNGAGPQNGRGAELEVAIIGAGIAGLCMAIKLREAGIENFAVFEKADGLGGTWRENTYPGAACDVPSFFYSFSFEPKADWSHNFARQSEILSYLEHCADAYGVRSRIRLRTEVLGARFDETSGCWTVRMRQGGHEQQVRARTLVSGIGQLNRPKWPRIPGRGRFEGASFHSARWDHGQDLAGRRVGVVGSGASAVQIVPEVVQQAAHLTVFQRTPNWLMPRFGRARTSFEKRLFARFPALLRLARAFTWARRELLWPLIFARSGRLSRPLVEAASRAYLRWQVPDPALRRALTPDYAPGCKRPLISDDYYPALMRGNVSLVTDGIVEITRRGVRTASGAEHALDVLVYATGFRSTEFLMPMAVRGRGGRLLREAWKHGAEAYLGMALPGFPNFYMLYGPNTNLGHNSIIFMIEQQVRYVVKCVQARRRRGLAALEVREDVMQRWCEECEAKLSETVWASRCRSWYKNKEGRITNNWPYSTPVYWQRLRKLDLSDYAQQSVERAVGEFA